RTRRCATRSTCSTGASASRASRGRSSAGSATRTTARGTRSGRPGRPTPRAASCSRRRAGAGASTSRRSSSRAAPRRRSTAGRVGGSIRSTAPILGGPNVSVTKLRLAAAAAAALLAVAAAPSLLAQQTPRDEAWTAPRTSWGDPDLRGMWPLTHLNGTPLQRPLEFGERRFLNDEEYAERVARLGALNARYDDEIETNKMGIGHWAEMGEPNRLASLIVEPANGRLPELTETDERISATMRSSWSNIPFDSLD